MRKGMANVTARLPAPLCHTRPFVTAHLSPAPLCHPERSRRVYSSAAHSERQTPDAKPSGVPFLLFCFRGSSAVYAVM